MDQAGLFAWSKRRSAGAALMDLGPLLLLFWLAAADQLSPSL